MYCYSLVYLHLLYAFLRARPVLRLVSRYNPFPRTSLTLYGPSHRLLSLSPFLPSLALLRNHTSVPSPSSYDKQVMTSNLTRARKAVHVPQLSLMCSIKGHEVTWHGQAMVCMYLLVHAPPMTIHIKGYGVHAPQPMTIHYSHSH